MTPTQQSLGHKCRIYDLGPTRVRVDAECSLLLDGFEWFLGERGSGSPMADHTFAIALRTGVPEPIPAGAETLYDGPLHAEGRCVFSRKGPLYFMAFPGETRMVIDQRARRADAVISPDHHERAHGSIVPIAIEFALDIEDQQVVHAAGLSLPGQDGMILVSAPSGTGKTTSALALARSGLSLAADDVMVLRRAGSRILAWGLPRALHIHRETAGLLPWLTLPTQWNDDGEQAVPRSALRQVLALEDRELPVSRLFLLRRGEGLAIEPMTKADALSALMADNVRGSTAGITPLQQRRLEMLADLVRTVPSYCMTVPHGLSGMESVAGRLMQQEVLK